MQALPEGAPATLSEAFKRINTCTNPSILDLQLMVLTEAAGKEFYGALAAGAPNEEVKNLLLTNGREELAHAHRVSRAIGYLTGADYPVPAAEQNPYLTGDIPQRPVTAKMLNALAETEFAGEDLYKIWADNCTNTDACALLRQSESEESRHGNRLRQAAGTINA
jgi:rubrerythrin